MFIDLSDDWANLLANLPEQGMGFQIVDIELKTGITYQKLYVYGSQMLSIPIDANFTSDDILLIKISEI